MANSRDIYESVTSLRVSTFELLDRMQDPAGVAPDAIGPAVATRLQDVANQLGAVEALVAPVTER